jgi:hypothetical protein
MQRKTKNAVEAHHAPLLVKGHFLINMFWYLLKTFGGLTILLSIVDIQGLSVVMWAYPQKGEKIGARRLFVYPFSTPYYQEGRSADGMSEFFPCTKPYAPTSHPKFQMAKITP